MIFFSENIKILRKRAGLTQGTIADFLGVNPNTISNYEKGNSSPDFALLEKIIKILDVDAHSLLYCDLSLTPAENSNTIECHPENILNSKTPKFGNNSNVPEFVPKLVPFRKLQNLGTNKGDDIFQRRSLGSEPMIPDQMVPVYETISLQSVDALFSQTLQPNSYLALPNLPKCDGAIRMWGDMMSPELQSGDLLVFHKVKDLRNGLFLGQIYLVSVVVEGEEYVMVQYVESAENADSVRLVSRNERYPAKEVPRSAIKALAMIKASVRYRSI